MLALGCNKWKFKYRSGKTQAQGYLPHEVMFRQRNPDYFAPKQFSKLVKGTGVFSCACVRVEFRRFNYSQSKYRNKF